MAEDIHVQRTNETVYTRRYTEKEVEALVREDLKRRVSELTGSPVVFASSRMMVENKDDMSSGPRRECVIKLTVKHGEEEEPS